jgi:hypothetical protein
MLFAFCPPLGTSMSSLNKSTYSDAPALTLALARIFISIQNAKLTKMISHGASRSSPTFLTNLVLLSSSLKTNHEHEGDQSRLALYHQSSQLHETGPLRQHVINDITHIVQHDCEKEVCKDWSDFNFPDMYGNKMDVYETVDATATDCSSLEGDNISVFSGYRKI